MKEDSDQTQPVCEEGDQLPCRLDSGFRRWLPGIAAVLIFAVGLTGLIVTQRRKMAANLTGNMSSCVFGLSAPSPAWGADGQLLSQVLRKYEELHRNKHKKEADRAFLQQALNQYKDSPLIQIKLRATLALDKQDPQEMRAGAQAVLDLAKQHGNDPNFAEARPTALELLALAARKEKDYTKEDQYNQEIVRLYPESVPARGAAVHLARNLILRGQEEDLPGAMRPLLEQHAGTPVAEGALIGLAEYYILKRDEKRATEIYEQLKALQSQSAESIKTSIDVWLRKGHDPSIELEFYLATEVKGVPIEGANGWGRFWRLVPDHQYFRTQQSPDFKVFHVKAKFEESPQLKDERQTGTSKTILLQMAKEDALALAKFTEHNIGKRIFIVFGSAVISAPVLKAKIADGNIAIPADDLWDTQIRALLGLPESAPLPKQIGTEEPPEKLKWALQIMLEDPAGARALLEEFSHTPEAARYQSSLGALIADCMSREGHDHTTRESKIEQARKLALEYVRQNPDGLEVDRAIHVIEMESFFLHDKTKAPQDLRSIQKAYPGTRAEVAALGSLIGYYRNAGQLDLANKIVDELAKLPGQAKSAASYRRDLAARAEAARKLARWAAAH